MEKQKTFKNILLFSSTFIIRFLITIKSNEIKFGIFSKYHGEKLIYKVTL